MTEVSPVKQGHSAGHPEYCRLGGSWGTVPIVPMEPTGSKAVVPAALAAWAACQPCPAAGLQRDKGDKGDGGTVNPAHSPGELAGTPQGQGAPLLPAQAVWVPGSLRPLEPAPAATDL